MFSYALHHTASLELKSFVSVYEVQLYNKIVMPTNYSIVIKETQEKFSKYHDVAMRLYHKCLTSVDFHTMTAVSPMTPSIADMMEWLEDADAQLYEQYPSDFMILKKTLFEQIQLLSIAFIVRYYQQ